MRLFLLENYESKEFEEWNNDEMVEKVKADCPKFVNEFIKKDHYVYRGLDNLSKHKAYLVPTQEYRLAHGRTFKNAQLALSFDKYLEQNDIGSRYRYSASTTTTDPDQYHGVLVDSWYYFIPKGNYQYHYHKGVKSDFNMSTSDSAIGLMKSTNSDISMVMYYYEALENSGVFEFDENSPMLLVYDHDYLKKFFRELAEMFVAMKNLYQNKNYNKIDKMVERLIEPVSTLARAFHESSDPDMELTGHHFLMLKRHMDMLENVGMTVFYFLKTVVGNEQGEHMGENEVVFTCKSYYVIPYNDEGKAFMEQLKH